MSENVDAVIDKMDPAIESATKEAKRLAEKFSKSVEPVAKTVQEGIGRFADKLGKWARVVLEVRKLFCTARRRG